MFGRFKKQMSILLTIVMLLFNVAFPVMSYAQVATPNDTSSPTPIDSSTPTSSVDPSSSPIVSPTDTPTPSPDSSLLASPTPNPSSTPGSDPSNVGTVNNVATSSAVTGDNSLSATDSATDNSGNQSGQSSSNTGGSSIQTGDAVSVVNAQNSVNSTAINSNVINQTINIYVTQNGDLNLSDPFAVAASAIQANPNDPVINVSFTTINNYAYISNSINSSANTGVNTANQSAAINTGNAYSAVSLLNQVNFTVLNSQIHIVTINIFGTLNGNIILPDVNASTNCSGCGINIASSNSGELTNNVNSSANTGQNSATGSADIQTGNASSITNILNLMNTNTYGINGQVLFINVLGNWLGNFIGWGNIGPQQGGSGLTIFNLNPGSFGSNGCSSCSAEPNITNFASVINNINSSANSGGNTLIGNGSITTGNSFNAVSLINFINSTFINSSGFFGFINIFGNWVGDIGGASNFTDSNNNNNQENVQSVEQTTPTNNNSNTPQEQGGQLAVTNANNTGKFVYPGDTITFFEKVNNIGTGKVYGVKLNLFLIYNGQIAGGTSFNLGDIEAAKGVKLNTGFVLSKFSPPGLYTARAYVTGNVGPNSQTVSATADSYFTIFSNIFGLGSNNPQKLKTVLGAHYPQNTQGSKSGDYGPLYALITVVIAYVALRGLREKDKVMVIFAKRITLEERMKSLKMFLL
jgi:hypothetical protein